MRRILLFAIFLILSLSPVCHAQTSSSYIGRLAETVNRFNRVFPQEKVYLHIDNTGYFMGETIWLKAYVVRTDKDSLGSLSHVLYVELVGPYGDVVKTQKLKIENGTAHGEIELNGLLGSGYYEIRAYTRYMLNWGKDAIFSRVIPIFERPEKEGDFSRPVIREEVNERLMPNEREEVSERRHRLNAHFYPEGGHMVEGLKGRMAFSLSDRQGRPVEGACKLLRNGKELLETRTNGDGRGVIEWIPTAEKTTLQVIGSDGTHEEFDIPKSETTGCVLSVNATEGDAVTVSLQSTADMHGQAVGIAWLQGGHMYKCEEKVLSANGITYSMPRSLMRDGVNQLTVIDEQGRILSHRMVFVYPKHPIDSIKVIPTNTKTLTGKKEVLEVQTPPNTTFSLAITDATTQTGGWYHNAATWLLLTSDLRGYISHPEYYLEADDLEHRQAADLLMMVQGWRRYDFQMMEGKKTFEMNHSLEDRLYIDGKLNQYKRKKTTDGVKMGVVLTNRLGDQLAGQTTTGAKGHYAFALPDCYRDWDVTIMTMKDDKFENYYVGINRHFSPEKRNLDLLETEPLELKEPMLKMVYPEGDDQSWKSDDVQILQEVKVTGKLWRNPRAFWERESRGARNARIWYNCELEADGLLDQGLPVPTLIGFLKQKNPLFTGNDNLSGISSYQNDSYNLYEDGLSYSRRPIIWIVNNRFFCATGMPTKNVTRPQEDDHPLEKPITFPTQLDEVKKVYVSMDRNDLRRFAPYLNTMGQNCVVVYVYSYNTLPVEAAKGIRMTHFDGFNVPKEYEQEMVTGLLPADDHRRTLYWNPNVRTNEEGKATIEFLNRPSCNLLNVSAECIGANGKPIINR